jgi:hypothetical protein
VDETEVVMSNSEMVRNLLITALAVAVCAPSARAHDNKPSLSLHVASAQGASCTSAPSDLSSINTSVPGAGDYAAYIVVNVPNSDYSGMDHFNFGTWYEAAGVQITGWHPCASRDYPSSEWPQPGSNVTVAWGTCENRSTFVAGWFDMTATGPGSISITGGDDHTVWMVGCGLRSYSLDETDLGWAAVGPQADGRTGCNPFLSSCSYGKAPPIPRNYVPGDNAIVLHVAGDDHNTCYDVPTSSDQVVTRASADAGGGARYNVYVIGVPKADEEMSWGLAGIEFGIDYSRGEPGSDPLIVQSWTSCSDLEFSGANWPQSGTGNMLTWVSPENCQTAGMVPAGYFTVSAYAPSSMVLIPHPVSGFAKVANCGGAEAVIENYVKPARIGWVSMGGGIHNASSAGCNPLLEPCDAVTPVQPTTWGKVKTLYGH